MYWPVGAPRIYTARNNKSTKNRIIAFDEEVIPQPVSKHPSDSQTDSGSESFTESFYPQKVGLKDQNHQVDSELTSPITSNYNIPSKNEVDQDGQPLASLWHDTEGIASDYPYDQPLLSLKISRSGHLFAAITSVSLTVWQTKPTAILAVIVRSKQSLQTYGSNTSLLMRPDSTIFVILTTSGYLITYELATNPTARVYRPLFSNNTSSQTRMQSKFTGTKIRGEDGILWGPGEGDGVREVSIRFQPVIRVDAVTGKALALDDELVVTTREPAAVQCIQWTPDCTKGQISSALLSNMDWLPQKATIVEMTHDCPMNLSAWITNDGKAYAVQRFKNPEDAEISDNLFKGYCFHTPLSSGNSAIKAAINARFSLIAIGCIDGTIQIYSARDYVGNIPPSHSNKSSVSEHSSGSLTCLTYSPDGYCLFAGYEKGWAMWSVFGKPGATSFENDGSISREQGEAWLQGVREAAWLGGGLELLIISHQDHRIWMLEMTRSATTSCYGLANISRMLLQTSSTIAVYRGYDLPNPSNMSSESSSWHVAQVPSSYLADQWPMRYSVISSDGRYIAVAGRRGLTHYSVSSGRWKTFADLNMENEFQIRGGMCWHQHILVAAVESGQSYQLRLYSREADLNISSVLHTETLPAPVVLIALSGEDSLLVYTHDNILYHFIFIQVSGKLKLVQVGQIAFHGIVRSPARVRGLSWILPDDDLLQDDPSKDVACATVLFLVDGKLVLLQPSLNYEGELKYDMRIVAQNVEYYVLMKDLRELIPYRKYGIETPYSSETGSEDGSKTDFCLKKSLWLFEGSEIKGWIDVQDVLHSTPLEFGREQPPMVSIPVDFYPLSILNDRGIILGLESELIQRQDVKFAYFKSAIRTHLFIPHVLQYHLSRHSNLAAIEFAQRYQSLDYFAHSLETLLHNVLDLEVDARLSPEEALLPRVTSFLFSFPQYLDIIVQCTRKTEIRSWRTLFKYLPPPQKLFEEALRRGSLKTAGGYLLVLQTFQDLSSSSEQLIRLFLRAKEEEDWTLCKELANFLIALDETGAILREAVEMLTLNSPIEKRQKIRKILKKIQDKVN